MYYLYQLSPVVVSNCCFRNESIRSFSLKKSSRALFGRIYFDKTIYLKFSRNLLSYLLVYLIARQAIAAARTTRLASLVSRSLIWVGVFVLVAIAYLSNQ